MTEIVMKDGTKYTFNLNYEYLYDLLCMIGVIDLKDIYGNNVLINEKYIERIIKVK